MESLSFDNMTELYDETREANPTCFNAALDFLADKFPPASFGRVFEPGIGTGRIAIPLARRGYNVAGVDISPEMLSVLDTRLTENDCHGRVNYQVADVTCLPYADGSFDMAIAVHLFYFIRDWRRAADEILRVLRPGCPAVLMNTGFGMEIPWMTTRYKQLCGELGFTVASVGVTSTSEVVAYCTSKGCQTETIVDRWKWTSRVSVPKALAYLKQRAYSYNAFVPETIHSQALVRLEAECAGEGPYADVASQIGMVVVQKP